jgi:hypothetical protein
MSVSETISSWKQKSEIDYFSLFFPLWLAFDAWCKDKYGLSTQRDCLEALKNDELNNRTYQKLKTLLQGSGSINETFKSYLTQLNQALEAVPIKYEGESVKTLSFKNALLDRNATPRIYEDLFRISGQHNKIELIYGIFITDEIAKIYCAYIEILYQVRCRLIHGDLSPNKENERIIKYLYLTLKDLMSEI